MVITVSLHRNFDIQVVWFGESNPRNHVLVQREMDNWLVSICTWVYRLGADPELLWGDNAPPHLGSQPWSGAQVAPLRCPILRPGYMIVYSRSPGTHNEYRGGAQPV